MAAAALAVHKKMGSALTRQAGLVPHPHASCICAKERGYSTEIAWHCWAALLGTHLVGPGQMLWSCLGRIAGLHNGLSGLVLGGF